MSSKQKNKKTSLRMHKNTGKVYNKETSLVFKSQKDLLVIGRIDGGKNGTFVEFDEKCLELCEEHDFLPDPQFLEDSEEEDEVFEMDSSEEEQKKIVEKVESAITEVEEPVKVEEEVEEEEVEEPSEEAEEHSEEVEKPVKVEEKVEKQLSSEEFDRKLRDMVQTYTIKLAKAFANMKDSGGNKERIEELEAKVKDLQEQNSNLKKKMKKLLATFSEEI